MDDDDILAILTSDIDEVDIPELGVRTSRRGDLAAFWDGYRAGRAGEKIGDVTHYDEPSIYKRAHERGRKSRNE